jgi:hypothetical protein
LWAIARQKSWQADLVCLLINNTRDRSAAIARDLAPALPFRLEVREQTSPPESASAGHARRAVMEWAAELAGARGVLLSTDADGCVAPDWIACNLAHLDEGAEAVAGRVELDPVDAAAIPDRLHEDDARECAYAAVLDEIAAHLDPDPWDPLPRHTEHSGASICVTVNAYRRAGGMPAVALGEDRAFFGALRRTDARIRHAPEVRVTVSGRIDGRALGGMADTIRRRLLAPDPWLDDALEPALVAVRRARLRWRTRRAFGIAVRSRSMLRGLASDLGMRENAVATALRAGFFGEAWARIEASSPVLVRARVPAAQLEAEMAAAMRELEALRSGAGGAAMLPDLAVAAAQT